MYNPEKIQEPSNQTPIHLHIHNDANGLQISNENTVKKGVHESVNSDRDENDEPNDGGGAGVLSGGEIISDQ